MAEDSNSEVLASPPAAKRLKTASSSATSRKVPTGDETLTPDDADAILDEIMEVQSQSYLFGLKLKLNQQVLDDIHTTYSEPRDCLLQVLKKVMNRVKPRPTWRLIINALKSPAVNLPRLAKIVEAAHFPSLHESTSPVSSSPETSSTDEVISPVSSSETPKPNSVATLSRPTLTELLNFKTSSGHTVNIVRQIGVHYSRLGLQLLNDDTGAVTSAIVAQHQRDAEEINQEILRRWLQGQGKQPVTWSTLIDVLRNIELLELAQMIQEHLIKVQVQEQEKKNTERQQQLKSCTQQLHTTEKNIRQLQQQIRLNETEKDDFLQAKDRELAQAHQQLRELRKQEQSSRREIGDLQRQLQSSEALVADFQKMLEQKDFELETLRPKETEKEELVRELDQAQQQLTQLRQQEQSKRTHVERLQQSSEALLKDINNFLGTKRTKVSGPGLHSATANHPTYFTVELTDYSSNSPCSLLQNVTAQLELISEATPTVSESVHVKKAPSPFQYEMSYTAIKRGKYLLHVLLNDTEINDSPFNVTVYPDPTQLHHPVRVVTNLDNPYAIAFNSRGEMIVTQRKDNQSLISIAGQKIQEYGDSKVKMSFPKGIAIDDMDNIYVSTEHQLHRFSSSGELIKSVGQLGINETEFDVPYGVTLCNNQVYVCDRNNHRIQVFDLDLNFIRSIGSNGRGEGEFNAPKDIKFDTDSNMYITEIVNGRVQVLDRNGHFIRFFGDEGEGKLNRPSCLHLVDKYIYVSDFNNNCILVYETSGEFVTSFGDYGEDKGHFNGPRCITSCVDGFIYVCDSSNGRIQIF